MTAAAPASERSERTSSSTPAWHSRAGGDLANWAAGYRPTSLAAAGVWEQHHQTIAPWIEATGPAGVTEARRVASAVLELLAWGLPAVGDLEACMTEELLQQFLVTNPTRLGSGALGNVRGRVRRVFRARQSQQPHPRRREKPSTAQRRSPEPAPYPEGQWLQLVQAVSGRRDLQRVTAAPWAQPAPATWREVRDLGAALGLELNQARVQLTINVRALVESTRPLAATLRDLRVGHVAASTAAAAMPAPDPTDYARALRGPGWISAGHCSSPSAEHRAGTTVCAPQAAESATLLTGGTAMTTPAPTPGPSQKSTPRRRRISARQARLANAAAQQEQAARVASFPEAMRTYIHETYRPRGPLAHDWEHLKGAVADTLAASAVRGNDSMRKFVTHLSSFFAWAHQADLPLGPQTLTRANLARYDNEVLAHGSASTRQTRRSRLAQMADQIHPEDAPIVGPPLEHRTVAAPYTDDEMAIIRRVARRQPTPELTRQICLLVGLGAGAGIDSTDLKRLRGCDVINHGPKTGIEVHVTNLRRSRSGGESKNRRTVWVLREYEDLVRIGIAGAHDDRPLLGRQTERANVAAAVFARGSFGAEVPALSQSRLRSTWITTHLARPTPLNTLLAAAGLTTARSLIDLLEHAPTLEPAHSMR